jgi:nicotinate-nucleotide adenylyltransferase
MRVGLFGGSFDPIHRGHVAAARAALAELGLDRVLFVTTAVPPHTPGHRFAPALARYAMVELALLDDDALQASPLELEGARPAFTVDTVERLRRERPDDELVLLIGGDSLARLETWHRWQDLVGAVELGVLARPGWERERIEPTFGPELARGIGRARTSWVSSVADPASASEIRRRLAAGEPLPAGWLDDRVLRFATKYSLYR